jgi:hypothetical protein
MTMMHAIYKIPISGMYTFSTKKSTFLKKEFHINQRFGG